MLRWIGIFIWLALAVACSTTSLPDAAVGHDVYLTLKTPLVEAEPELVAALVADCRDLARIPEILRCRAGARDVRADRSDDDQEFHVALQLVFESRAALDRYRIHPIHREFLQVWGPRLRRVRVFDSAPGAARPPSR